MDFSDKNNRTKISKHSGENLTYPWKDIFSPITSISWSCLKNVSILLKTRFKKNDMLSPALTRQG